MAHRSDHSHSSSSTRLPTQPAGVLLMVAVLFPAPVGDGTVVVWRNGTCSPPGADYIWWS